MNQELIKRLADGEIQLQNTGTVEQLREILAAAFPNDGTNSHGTFRFYKRWSSNNPYNWRCNNKAYNLPIYTTEQFFEDETEHIPEVRKKMDAETRKFAKQLLIHNDNFTQEECIELAKDFIQLLNEHE
jgi:hypothetical protein